MNENRPEFFKAWQALALVSSTMKQSEMLSLLYAYNAYYYIFDNYSDVKSVVLADFDSDQQLHIYRNSDLGMNTVEKLVVWVTAADGED